MKNPHLIGLMVIALTACTQSSEPSVNSNENVFQTQIDAVDRAREVEGKILDTVEQQRQTIEENTE